MVFVLLPLVLGSIALASPLARQDTRQYTVHNRCPMPIKLYIGGAKDSTIPINGIVVKTLSTNPGFFYTDANHDGASPTGEGTTRAGFHDDYYYIVADPRSVNTGMQVKPSGAPSNGFCGSIECDGLGCAQAFTQPPTAFAGSTSTPPAFPYYRCPAAGTNYDITFCPTGTLPDQGKPIYFNGHSSKCLTVQGGVFANGTPVQIYDCYGTQRQRWVINRGSTKVQLAATNFCLDPGPESVNGSQLKISPCNDIPEQQWSYTVNNHVILQNRGLCVDLENGVTTNSNKVQTWACSDSNTNQVWTL